VIFYPTAVHSSFERKLPATYKYYAASRCSSLYLPKLKILIHLFPGEANMESFVAMSPPTNNDNQIGAWEEIKINIKREKEDKSMKFLSSHKERHLSTVRNK
jgi:hypothetical protein